MTQLTVERLGPVACVAFVCAPDGLMSNRTVRELNAALDDLEADPSTRAIVFTGGRPDVFIRHYDVSEIVALGKVLRSTDAGLPDARDMPVHGLFNRIEACEKVTIAAINGTCMGGGFELALCCDLRFAGDGDFPIGLPEVRLGIFSGGGGTQRLVRTIGQAAALDCILRGRTFTPREAAARGLVHDRILGDVAVHAVREAQILASRPPAAVAAIKRLVRAAPDLPLDEGLENEWRAFGALLAEDTGAMEIMQDFLTLDGRLDRR